MFRAAAALLACTIACAASAGAPQIVVETNRQSGVAPLAVYFDASPSTGLAGGDLVGAHFSWGFGDPDSGTWATTGGARNEAIGYQAAHVFEAPGTYIVSVQVKDASGAEDSKTLSIVVDDPELVYAGATRCVSQLGDFSGAPPGCSVMTSADLAAQGAWLRAAAGRRLLLRRGEVWDGNLDFTNAAQCTLGAFGSGARPIIRTQTGAEQGVWMNGQDCRLIDIDIDGSFAGPGESAGGGDGTNNLALRVRARDSAFVGWGMGGDYTFLVDSEVVNNDYFSVYSDGVGVVIQGSRIDQIRAATSFLRPLESRNVVIAHNLISASRPAPTTGIKWHSRRGVITGNHIIAGTGRISLSNSDGFPTGLDVDANLGVLLIEGNHLGPANDPVIDQYNSYGVTFAFNSNVVVRNNLLVDTNIAFGGNEGFASDVRILHNTVLMTDAVQGLNMSNGDFLAFDMDLDQFEISNNLVAILATISGSAYPEPGVFINLKNLGGLSMRNNLVYKPDHAIEMRVQQLGAPALFYTFPEWLGLGIEQASLQANPAFVSIAPGSAEFLALSASSPAIDAAINRGVWADVDGGVRPVDGDGSNGAQPDIGAREYGSGAPAPQLFRNGFEG